MHVLDRFTKTHFLELGLRLWIFFSLGPIETTFRKYTFHKNRFFYPHRPKMTKKWPKMTKKKFWPKNFGFFYRDLALAVSVVLPPWDPFFDFSFPSYGRFHEGTPPTPQNDKIRSLLTKTAMTRKRKVEKWIPRWRNDRNGEG